MNKYIFIKELKRGRKSLLIVLGTISILIILTMSLFSSFASRGDITEIMKAFPDELIKAFSMDFENFNNILGFYNTYNIFYIMLGGGFYSIIIAAGFLSKEERNKTAEYLYSKPLNRSEIIMSKFLAYLCNILILSVGIIIIGFISLEIFKVDDYNIGSFFVLSLYYTLLLILLGTIGFFISSLIKRGKNNIGLYIGIVAGAYFIDAISKITENAKAIGYISPFKFVNIDVLNPAYGLEWWRLLYFIGISSILIFFTFLIYNKKDIYV
jgi:ABC-2 type transport system permease protein